MNKAIIKHAYEASIDRIARLTTYVMAKSLHTADEEVSERCRRLAVDDLILLAISMRRVVEVTNLVALCQNKHVSTAMFGVENNHVEVYRVDNVSVWQALGVIIHSRTIEVWDDEIQLIVLDQFRRRNGASEMLESVVGVKSKRIDPICYIKSDKQGICICLDELCWRSGELLEAVRDACDEQNIFLDHFISDI